MAVQPVDNDARERSDSAVPVELPQLAQQLSTPCISTSGTVAGGNLQQRAAEAGLHGVVTWNVAGWRSAVSGIRKDWGSIEAFLKHLHCDILCIQVRR